MDNGWKTKSWVSLNLQDKTNNCDQNQNPQTIATKELGLKKKILWNLKTNGAVQPTYLTCTISASLRKEEAKENNSCLMGPETRQSHTSQQNSQGELAGQCERRNRRWKVYPVQALVKQPAATYKEVNSHRNPQCRETFRHWLELEQDTEHRRKRTKNPDQRKGGQRGNLRTGIQLPWHILLNRWFFWGIVLTLAENQLMLNVMEFHCLSVLI